MNFNNPNENTKISKLKRRTAQNIENTRQQLDQNLEELWQLPGKIKEEGIRAKQQLKLLPGQIKEAGIIARQELPLLPSKINQVTIEIKNEIIESKYEILAMIFVSVLASLMIMISAYVQFKLWYNPTLTEDDNPCPIPSGSYIDSCTNITSALIIDDNKKCNFNAVCGTGEGLKWGKHSLIGGGKYGRYGDTLPNASLVQNEIMLPTFTQFKELDNIHGQIKSAWWKHKSRGVYFATAFVNKKSEELLKLENIKTTNILDEDGKIKLSFSDGNNAKASTVVTSAVTIATLALTM